MSPNDADGMANSVDPDQTAPLGAVWSESALFAQAYLSENLGYLRYKLNTSRIVQSVCFGKTLFVRVSLSNCLILMLLKWQLSTNAPMQYLFVYILSSDMFQWLHPVYMR